MLSELNGGRMPVGISSAKNPGPFAASLEPQGRHHCVAGQQPVVDAVNTAGRNPDLERRRPGHLPHHCRGRRGWLAVPEKHVSAAVTELSSFESASAENVLWSRWLPAAFLIAALVLFGTARRNRRQLLITAPSP